MAFPYILSDVFRLITIRSFICVFRLIITHQRRSPVESFTELFALIEYLCETQINERIVIKRKTSDNIYGNAIIEN